MNSNFGKQNFQIGCNYWASHAGTNMWHDWRPEIVEDDFKKLSALKLEIVRIFPMWPDFQPLDLLCRGSNVPYELRWKGEEPIPFDEDGNQSGVDPEMLERFKFVCDCAEKYNLKLGVGLVTGWMSGRMYAPRAFSHSNLLRDPMVIRWQLRMVKRIVSKFRDHKAIAFWGIGNECNCLDKANRHEGALWAETITDAIRSCDPTRPVVAGMHGLVPQAVSSPNLTPSAANWSIQDMGEIFDCLTVHPYPSFTPYMAIDRLTGIKNVFHASAEAHLYGDIAKKPCVAEELGTLAPNWGNEQTAANYLRNTLLNLWAHDCEGLYWWCGFDQLNLEHPPYQWCGVERELGLYRNDGSCKEVGKVLRTFADMREKLPFKNLPKFRKDAICVLNEEHDAWKIGLGTWTLAKQAGFDIEFQYEDEPIRDSKVYIVPSLCGLNNMPKDRYTELFKKVEDGATLYVSFDGASIAQFEKNFGMTVETQEGFAGSADIELSGGKLPFSFNWRLTMAPCGAEVLLRDCDNRAVLSKFAYGKGTVYFMSYPVEKHIVMNNGAADKPYYEIYRMWAAEVLDSREFTTDVHNLTVTIHKIDEKSAYAVVVNNNDDARPLNAQMNGTWQITDVIYGDIRSIKGHDCLILKLNA